MPSPEMPLVEQEFTPQSEAQIALEAKKQIKEALAPSPVWQKMQTEMSPDELEPQILGYPLHSGNN